MPDKHVDDCDIVRSKGATDYRMNRECVRLIQCWNNTTFMHLPDEKGKQILFLPRLCINESHEGSMRICNKPNLAFNDIEYANRTTRTLKEAITKLRQ